MTFQIVFNRLLKLRFSLYDIVDNNDSINIFLHRYNITTDDGPREFTAKDNDK